MTVYREGVMGGRFRIWRGMTDQGTPVITLVASARPESETAETRAEFDALILKFGHLQAEVKYWGTGRALQLWPLT
jgi:hypothetical protein